MIELAVASAMTILTDNWEVALQDRTNDPALVLSDLDDLTCRLATIRAQLAAVAPNAAERMAEEV